MAPRGRDLDVAHYMTTCPHAIGCDQSLATALKIMSEFGIHHLPVLQCGSLVGLLSERDILAVEALEHVDPTRVVVDNVMVRDPFIIEPHESLAVAASTMAERHIGSAVVAHKGKVLGVFTSVDALRALSELLEA